MVAELSVALYDATKALTFATRRANKTFNGDIDSAVIAGGQAKNGLKAIAKLDNALGKTAKTCVLAIDKAAEGKSALGYVAKGVNVVSNSVNPAIVILGGLKVANAKDKKSELINQSLALGTMFSAEKFGKLFLTEQGRNAILKNKHFGQSEFIKKLVEYMNKIDKYSMAADTSKVGKVGIPILKAAAFIGLSIAGYSIGSDIAKKINQARKGELPPKSEQSTSTDDIAKQPKTKKTDIEQEKNTVCYEA